MQLITPTSDYEQSYVTASEKSKDETNHTTLRRPNTGETFAEFVKRLNDESYGKQLPDGWVPATEFWLIDDHEFIGAVNIRHQLTEHLLKIGGHIGYWIRPAKRNMGYGKEILRLALPEAKKLGMTKVLLTCDDTNIGSRKIIEANGGVLENIVDVGTDHPRKRRYWINL